MADNIFKDLLRNSFFENMTAGFLLSGIFSTGATGALAPVILGQPITVTAL